METTHIIKLDDTDVKVIVKNPSRYQNRIVKYGWVMSFSGHDKFHKISKKRFGPNRFGYSCDCEDNFWRGRLCKHIAAFKMAEGK